MTLPFTLGKSTVAFSLSRRAAAARWGNPGSGGEGADGHGVIAALLFAKSATHPGNVTLLNNTFPLSSSCAE